MPKLENRSQMMSYLGAEQRNTVWSWCAVDDDEKKVYFSLWADTRRKDGDETSYLVQEPHWGINEETGRPSAARNDHDEKLRLAFEEGYETFGYVVVAKDPGASPRQIEETRTGFIFEIELLRQHDGSIRGAVRKRINLR